MNETLTKIESAVKTDLDKGGMGEFAVEARITAGRDIASSLDGSELGKRRNITLVIKSTNPAAELNPTPYEEYIASALAKMAPLAPHFEYKKPEPVEPQKDHLHHLREKFDAVIGKAHAAGIAGSFKNYSDWFEERAKLEALKGTTDQHVIVQHEHAISASRNDNFISVSFTVPSGVNADEVQKDIENRKNGILTLLGRMVAKKLKLTRGSAEETAIIEKVKTFEMVPTTQSWGSGHTNVNIEFRSPEVTAAMKEPGGLIALSAGKQKALKDSNPLMQLKDGDGLTPENPADLQKAIARAILFEGVNGEKPIDLFAKIAGPLDERRGIEKTLNYIKAVIKSTQPAIVADIDAILNDSLFKEHSSWMSRMTKEKDGKSEKTRIHAHKTEEKDKNNEYIKGLFRVDLSIPEDKGTLQEVENQLAALASAPAAQTAPATLTADTIKTIVMDTIAEVNAAAPPSAQDKIIAGGAPTVEGWGELLKAKKAAEEAAKGSGRVAG